eukprot:4483778-Ditylum_brightwellii.AAC.1
MDKVDFQLLLEANTLLELKSGEKIDHILPSNKKCRSPINAHVKVQALYEPTNMIDYAVVLTKQVSSSLKESSSAGF